MIELRDVAVMLAEVLREVLVRPLEPRVGLDREAEWALIELERAGRLGKGRQSC